MSEQCNEVLWTPDEQFIANARVSDYQRWLAESRGLRFTTYDELWRWSTTDLGAFWRSVWDYFEIESETEVGAALEEEVMPGAQWFSGVTLNYAAQVFRNRTTERPAIVFQGESTDIQEVSWSELESDVASLAAYLRESGVQPGDRVVGYLPNIPDATKAFLACASVGAIWSMCAPDLGVKGVLDRFQQIRPKVLIAANGYIYNGKHYDRAPIIEELVEGLPGLETLIVVECGGGVPKTDINSAAWEAAIGGSHQLEITKLAFDHPLWILYSSGTTGKPKAIVHGHGGVLIEHLKSLSFSLDIGSSDRFFWYSSTAWMMWNYHIGGLLLGATICTYDGNPARPDMNRLWQFIEQTGVSVFGAGAAFYDGCRNAGISPKAEFDLSQLRVVGSTGSPLLPEAYRWIYKAVGANVLVTPISGGTDFVSLFVGGNPVLPVRLGEMSSRCLGAAVAAYNDNGEEVIGEVGELVCTKPMPSMPLFFWNDENGSQYNDSYFDTWPGVWRHGDWILITQEGGAIIYGRSDATINRHGIRMGTSELYGAVEALPEIVDSLVVDLEFLGRESYMPLFVVLKDGVELDADLEARLRDTIKKNLSPRHVPNEVFAVDDVPRTFSGKKLEIPVRKLLLGQAVEKVINKDTMGNPESIDFYIEFAKSLQSRFDQMP